MKVKEFSLFSSLPVPPILSAVSLQCLLCNIDCALFLLHLLFCTVYFALFTFQCLHYIFYSELFSLHCLLCNVNSALFTLHCLMCTVYSAMFQVVQILRKGRGRRITSGSAYLTAFYQDQGRSSHGGLFISYNHLVLLPQREQNLCCCTGKIKSSPCQSYKMRFSQPGQ